MDRKKLISRILCFVLIFSMILPGGLPARADEDYDRLNLFAKHAFGGH